MTERFRSSDNARRSRIIKTQMKTSGYRFEQNALNHGLHGIHRKSADAPNVDFIKISPFRAFRAIRGSKSASKPMCKAK